MLKIVATTALALVLAAGVHAEANEREAGGKVQTDAGEDDARERARAVLAERLKIPADDISVKRIEPATWSDSSMGCGKPGTMALTVMTEGYVVTLSAQERDHRVHVSKASAIVCNQPTLLRRDRTATNARGLDLMISQAKQDLSQKIGVQESTIKVAGMQPRQFADSALACPAEGEALESGSIEGYELSLRHGRRFFTYYTDLKTVRACPAIETK